MNLANKRDLLGCMLGLWESTEEKLAYIVGMSQGMKEMLVNKREKLGNILDCLGNNLGWPESTVVNLESSLDS